jgi:phosphatidylglycerophosphate synthase
MGIERGHVVANLLSLARIPLAALLWVLPYSAAWVLSVIAVAGLTDVLDGWLVRRERRHHWERRRDPAAFAAGASRGEVIDGAADKIFVLSALALLAWTRQPPIWALLALAAREILFVPMLLAYRLAPARLRTNVDFKAGKLGKIATLAQFAALVLGLLESSLFTPAAALAGALGVAAAAFYLVRSMMKRERRERTM